MELSPEDSSLVSNYAILPGIVVIQNVSKYSAGDMQHHCEYIISDKLSPSSFLMAIVAD
jgi:hypothetical protein